jgi:hypothetical protein
MNDLPNYEKLREGRAEPASSKSQGHFLAQE